VGTTGFACVSLPDSAGNLSAASASCSNSSALITPCPTTGAIPLTCRTQ
jgi:hypothetical protein